MEKEYLPDAAGVLSKKRRRRRWQKVVGALAAVVAFCTTYALILPAITEEHTTICGLEEHVHTETCYQETQRLVCGLEETEGHTHTEGCYIEEPVLLCGLEETGGHVHTEDCYTEEPVLLCGQEESEDHVHSAECWGTERVLTCGLEETEPHTHSEDCWGTERVLACGLEEAESHVHTEACYETEQTMICELEEHDHTEECYAPVEDEPESDPTADVETQADWEATLRDITLTGEWPQDVLAVAESQLGYQESSRNFAINEDGKLKGYTRYGAWYGDPYGDWCAMFASFCLHYAEVEDFPLEANCQRWIEALRGEKYDLYREAHPEEPEEPYLPNPGDLIFFDWESGEEADHVGFVAEFIPASDGVPAQIKTLEGNAGDRVRYETYEVSDSRILGYAALPEQTFYCGLPGHVHETACQDAAGELVCGLEEHIHTEECKVPPEVQEDDTPAEETLLGQSVFAEQSQAVAVFLDDSGAFTYTDTSTGLTATLALNNSSYTTENYYLVVARQDAENYKNALNSFTTHGQKIEEAAIYKIYLVSRSNGQVWTNLNCAYTLEMRWSNGLFTQVDSSDFLNFTYCKNSGSEPTELSNCQVTYSEDGNVTALTATDSYYPNSAEFMFVRSSAPNGLTAGQYKLTYNEGKDVFLTDPAYSQYYNSNSPIGTAGSFHIVAFDSAYLNAHTNGNVLAKNLYAGANFGTNGFAKELSYIQNYKQVNGSSASSSDHILVIGSENTVEFVDNGNAFAINGTKIDRPYNLIQDVDTATAPFIDLNRVRAEISQIAGNLNRYPDANLTYTSAATLNADHSKLELTTPSGVGVVNYTAAELAAQLGSYVQIDGFQTGSNGTVVINVDCTGVTQIDMPQARIVIDGQLQGTSEVTEFSAGKVIWNFVNADGVTIHTQLMTGIILAPGATVNINQNLNGTVVADIINVNAESHRTDFTGKVIEPDETPEENEYYVTVQKIETGYAGTALPGAQFDLYQWDGNDWAKVNTTSLVTGTSGTVMLHNLDATVAYKLVETKAPAGYVLKDGAFYFWVRTDKNQTQPNQRPSDFSGSIVEVGGTLLAANDKQDVTAETTSLTVTKLWKAADGTELTDITVESITVKVYQIADGDTENKTLYQELTLSTENGWTVTLEELPLTGSNGDGSEIQYTYTAEEDAVDGYQTTYETEYGIVTITNTKDAAPGGDYVLPETGGSGTTLYTLEGLLLTTAAGFLLLYRHTLRRKEDSASP